MVDIEEIYKTCLEAGAEHTVTGTTVLNFVKAPFNVWCDRFAPEDARDPPSRFLEYLMEQGRQHEQATVTEAYPEAETVEYTTPKEGFGKVLESMRDGVTAMHDVPIFYLKEGIMGIADSIERRDTNPSVFGNYHYVIKEIKLAKNIREYHSVQAAFYNYVLGKVQRYTPGYFFLINRDRVEERFPYNETDVLDALSGIRLILDGMEITPTYGSSGWPWETFCNREAIRRKDVSLIPSVGSSLKKRLLDAGFMSVPEVASATIQELTTLRGVGRNTARRLKENATAIVQETHIKLVDVMLPHVSTEIFLDLEGTGEQLVGGEVIDIDYLIGVLVRTSGREEYRSFLANTLEGEGQMFNEFLAWLERQDDYVIYHWHHYERTHLYRLTERYGISKEMQSLLFGSLKDLHKVAVSSFAFPTYGQGLKPIASYMGFSWRDEDVDAMTSMAHFFQYVQDPEKNRDKLKKVVDYNEDDCIATRVVKDWLERELQES